MTAKRISWLGAITYAIALANAHDQLWPRTTYRVHSIGSIVVDDYLYLDSGEVYSDRAPNAVIASTLRIPLNESWSTGHVPATFSDKPWRSYPFARQPAVWTDGSNIYSAGGLRYYFPGCEGLCFDPIWQGGVQEYFGSNYSAAANKTYPFPEVPPINETLIPMLTNNPYAIWTVPLKNWGKEPWKPAQNQPPSSFSQLQSASTTQVGNKFYALGGFSGYFLSLKTADPKVYSVPGLASWNVDGTDFKNTSSSAFQPYGFVAQGQSIFAPFGSQGMIVYIGGVAPSGAFEIDSTGTPDMPMQRINLYDIASGKFFSQTATGDIPAGRLSFCVVGASESNSETFDIFVFGGDANVRGGETAEPSLSKVYVLSLPSFTWSEAQGSETSERADLTCQVVGNRQMLAVGGLDPTQTNSPPDPDPWTNFMGLFDMTKWEWKFEYNHRAAPYTRNSVLVEATKQQPYPKKWDSKVLENMFVNNTYTSKYSQSQSSGGTDTGAIAGGVVGGVVGVVLIAGIAWFFIRRSRRRNDIKDRTEGKLADTENGYPYPEDKPKPVEAPVILPPQELPATKKPVELGPEPAWELEEGDENHTWSSTSDDTKVSDTKPTIPAVRHELEG